MSKRTADNPENAPQAARVLRAILKAVDVGELEAPGPEGKRLIRRVEGAITALEGIPKERSKVR